MGFAALSRLLPSHFQIKGKLGLIDLKSTCAICRIPPTGGKLEEGGEQWCLLQCGHKFGHKCIRRLLEDPECRSCPTCKVPVTCTCGHPVTPAALPRLRGCAKSREVRTISKVLAAQAEADCEFCREHKGRHRDTVAVLAALDLDVGTVLPQATAALDYPWVDTERPSPANLERGWKIWWAEESANGPQTVRAEKERVDYHYDIYLP
ncbi:uncharacterized protein DNG_01143 [Cephalotrichum gorgonifer]|uniref:RING-type domain-containing protein n=1 Tax=Cephalotrichum gorgonifer TaxID=2041049 RepID=A0AAE8MSE4_9PEZI|nr:uncharacterized protein DNG_01143 [Cephalotrichum gorgonifer]